MKKTFGVVVFLYLFSLVRVFASGNADNTNVSNQQQKVEIKESNPSDLINKKIESYNKDFTGFLSEDKFEKACEIYKTACEELSSVNVVPPESEAIVFEMKHNIDSYLNSFKFEKVKAPNAAVKNKAFSSPFVVRLNSEDHSAVKIPVMITFPKVSEEGELLYYEKLAQTDEEGLISFECPVSSVSYNKTITFSLAFDGFDNLPKIELPCRVATNMKASGGSIAFVDFTKGGNPITTNSETSSLVLTALINKGFTRIGNCDFTSQIVAGNDEAVQKEASSLFGKNVTYLIYGTVKYEKVEKVEDGFIVALKGSMKVRNVLEDKEMLVSEQTIEIKEKSEWAATNSARKKLAAAFADQVLYGI